MNNPRSHHHRHLEQARSQVIELLSRQAVERALVERAENRNRDVVAQLLARQQQTALVLAMPSEAVADVLRPLASDDIADLVSSLPDAARQAVLHRFGRDPVLGSSIVLTATTDSMGFLIFLGLAAMFLV